MCDECTWHHKTFLVQLTFGNKVVFKKCYAVLLFSQLKSRDFYKTVVLGVFGVTDEALTALLKDESLPMDWSKSTVFCGQCCETQRGSLKPFIPVERPLTKDCPLTSLKNGLKRRDH